jgi:hypothetical protein
MPSGKRQVFQRAIFMSRFIFCHSEHLAVHRLIRGRAADLDWAKTVLGTQVVDAAIAKAKQYLQAIKTAVKMI